MILSRIPVPPAPRRVGVGVSVVLVPDRGDIPRIGFEEELWHRISARRTLTAHQTSLLDGRVRHWQLDFIDRVARSALEIVTWH